MESFVVDERYPIQCGDRDRYKSNNASSGFRKGVCSAFRLRIGFPPVIEKVMKTYGLNTGLFRMWREWKVKCVLDFNLILRFYYWLTFLLWRFYLLSGLDKQERY